MDQNVLAPIEMGGDNLGWAENLPTPGRKVHDTHGECGIMAAIRPDASCNRDHDVQAVNHQKKGRRMAGEVGERAPDFTLSSTQEGDITLSQYQGTKHVILSFHVLNFTGG